MDGWSTIYFPFWPRLPGGCDGMLVFREVFFVKHADADQIPNHLRFIRGIPQSLTTNCQKVMILFPYAPGWDQPEINRNIGKPRCLNLLHEVVIVARKWHSKSSPNAKWKIVRLPQGNKSTRNYSPRKLTYPLNTNGWKMRCPFEMVPFFGGDMFFIQFSRGYKISSPILEAFGLPASTEDGGRVNSAICKAACEGLRLPSESISLSSCSIHTLYKSKQRFRL